MSNLDRDKPVRILNLRVLILLFVVVGALVYSVMNQNQQTLTYIKSHKKAPQLQSNPVASNPVASNANTPKKQEVVAEKTYIYKYLNRVSKLNEDDIFAGDIWKSCILDGWEERLPSSQVVGSRSLKEMTNREWDVIKYENITENVADQNGMVTTVSIGKRPYKGRGSGRGYCIGSEFLLK